MNFLAEISIFPGAPPECKIIDRDIDDAEAFKRAYERQFDVAAGVISLEGLERGPLFPDELSPRTEEIINALFDGKEAPKHEEGDYERIHFIHHILTKHLMDDVRVYNMVIEPN